MNRSAPDEPRVAELPHDSAMTLALNEYRRFGALLLALHEEDWTTPTECPGWDVRAMASHALAMVEMSASYRENNRQVKAARRRGGDFLDALTAVQVEEHADLAPEVITERYLARSPKAARARRRLPGLIRRRALPVPQVVGGQEERWTVGYLTDVIFTRDPWMHRIDITRATGAELVHTVGHDAAIVADVVLEWADRHGRPYTLHLAGPAGGEWSRGTGGPSIDLDAVAFCRIVSGRGPAEGLLTTQVPF